MQRRLAYALALAAMATVGGAVTASHYLGDYPRYGAQAVRYGLASLLLAALMSRQEGWVVRRPVGTEWFWLIAASTAGMTIYNLAVVAALRHAEPTVVATAVSCVPLVLAIGAPVAARRAVPAATVGAAVIVVIGAALVQGGGRSTGLGLVLAIVALAGEAGFTLLGVPVLARLGAASVALHTSWIAAVELAVVGLVIDGRHVVTAPSASVVVAIAYLVAASAFAFGAWFAAVDAIGGEHAGLAAGVIPIAAVVTGMPLGLVSVNARTVGGMALVVCGIAGGAWLHQRSTRDSTQQILSEDAAVR